MSRSSRSPRSTYLFNYQSRCDLHEIIIGIVNGIDISLVDPLYFPTLEPRCHDYILKFQDRNDDYSISRIQFAIDYINDYPRRQMIHNKLLVKPPPPKVVPKPYEDEELEAEADKVENGDIGQKYTVEQHEAIVAELRKRRADYIQEEEYLKAENAEKMCRQLIQTSEFAQASEIQETKTEDYDAKLQEAKAYYQSLQTRWKNCFAVFDQRMQEEIQKLQEQQENEYNEMVKLRDQPPPPAFSKFSNDLLILRKREKSLVISKRYNEAEETKMLADVMEEKEIIQQNRDWQAEIDDRLNKLQTKHQKQMFVRNQNAKRERNQMVRNSQHEMDSAKKKIIHLEKCAKESKNQLETMTSVHEPPPSTATIKSRGSITTRSNLPKIDNPYFNQAISVSTMTPHAFRQRALLNMKIYRAKPNQKRQPYTAR